MPGPLGRSTAPLAGNPRNPAMSPHTKPKGLRAETNCLEQQGSWQGKPEPYIASLPKPEALKGNYAKMIANRLPLHQLLGHPWYCGNWRPNISLLGIFRKLISANSGLKVNQGFNTLV